MIYGFYLFSIYRYRFLNRLYVTQLTPDEGLSDSALDICMWVFAFYLVSRFSVFVFRFSVEERLQHRYERGDTDISTDADNCFVPNHVRCGGLIGAIANQFQPTHVSIVFPRLAYSDQLSCPIANSADMNGEAFFGRVRSQTEGMPFKERYVRTQEEDIFTNSVTESPFLHLYLQHLRGVLDDFGDSTSLCVSPQSNSSLQEVEEKRYTHPLPCVWGNAFELRGDMT